LKTAERFSDAVESGTLATDLDGLAPAKRCKLDGIIT
jgi:hypothetical protein